VRLAPGVLGHMSGWERGAGDRQSETPPAPFKTPRGPRGQASKTR
jgi:hypothetical protein